MNMDYEIEKVSFSKSGEIKNLWKNAFLDAKSTLELFMSSEDNLLLCEKLTEVLFQTFKRGANVFICGNGGSHCDAMHFAEECTGRFSEERKALGALALGDPSHTTCVANDFGFQEVFSRQLEGLARKGDLLIGLSTSGLSKNVINAFKAAEKMGLYKVSLLGQTGGILKGLSDLAIRVPSQKSSRIQEVHIKILHTAVETVEKRLF